MGPFPLLTLDDDPAFAAENEDLTLARARLARHAAGGDREGLAATYLFGFAMMATVLAPLATTFGLIWSGFVVAAGMLVLTDLGLIAELANRDPVQAATAWRRCRPSRTASALTWSCPAGCGWRWRASPRGAPGRAARARAGAIDRTRASLPSRWELPPPQAGKWV